MLTGGQAMEIDIMAKIMRASIFYLIFYFGCYIYLSIKHKKPIFMLQKSKIMSFGISFKIMSILMWAALMIVFYGVSCVVFNAVFVMPMA